MEQLFIIIIILFLSVLLFLTSYFLYKKSPKMSMIPPISTFILTIILLLFARSVDDWGALIYVVLGTLIGLSTIIGGLSLLIYHLIKRTQNN